MSEYQYYEFLAIDKPLTSRQMSALRAMSTRAHITPTSFTNEYHWGNFKGKPKDLMRRFFDAHVYVANWMSATFMVRIPIKALTKSIAKAMEVKYLLTFEATKTHWIINWSLEESENYNRFGMDDGSSWMARLAPVRDELLRGDFRSLYIGWLAGVSGMEEDDLEPQLMEGLGELTVAQRSLAEFLEVDVDLLAGAGIGSPAQRAEAPSQQAVEAWLEGLSRDKMLALFKQLQEGGSLQGLYSAWCRSLQGAGGRALPRRSIKELKENSTKAKVKRIDGEERAKEKREAKRRKEREKYLATLYENLPKAWRSVQGQISVGTSKAYGEACKALVDLSEAYTLCGSRGAFDKKLKGVMSKHLQRRALVRRLVEAGIWRET